MLLIWKNRRKPQNKNTTPTKKTKVRQSTPVAIIRSILLNICLAEWKKLNGMDGLEKETVKQFVKNYLKSGSLWTARNLCPITHSNSLTLKTSDTVVVARSCCVASFLCGSLHSCNKTVFTPIHANTSLSDLFFF